MDWVERADRFWASEPGIDAGMLRRDGFHICERADVELPPRAILVGTSSGTILGLPAGRTAALEEAGVDVQEMKRAPRQYVTSLSASSALEVRGPAYLAYWPPSFPPPSPRGPAHPLDRDDRAALVALRDVAPEEWAEAGIGADPQGFGALLQGRIVAVAAYERWSEQLAHLQVFCHPEYRRRGLAADALVAAVRQALADDLLPQYRARDTNAASRGLASRLGFVEYGWMATILVRVHRHPVQWTGGPGAGA